MTFLNKFPVSRCINYYQVQRVIEITTNFYNYSCIYREFNDPTNLYLLTRIVYMHDLHEQQTDYFINSQTSGLNDKTTFIIL